jgi:Uma2 family endonuclease
MPLSRIRFDPPPGQATEQDVLDIHDRENRLCELVDGVLVEKTVGFQESYIAAALIGLLRASGANERGAVVGADGMMRLAPGLVRIPDVSFISWEKFPGQRVSSEPIPDLAPNLAVEVLSPRNTSKEMERKLDDYFAAGVELVWYIDPETRTVAVFTARDEKTILNENQTLDGSKVLPTFALPVRDLFAKLASPAPGQGCSRGV